MSVRLGWAIGGVQVARARRLRLANRFDLCLLVDRLDACAHCRLRRSFRRVGSAARGRRRPEPRREGRAKGSRGGWAVCVLRVPVVGQKEGSRLGVGSGSGSGSGSGLGLGLR